MLVRINLFTNKFLNFCSEIRFGKYLKTKNIPANKANESEYKGFIYFMINGLKHMKNIIINFSFGKTLILEFLKLIKQEIKNAPINMYKALKISIIIAPRLFCMMFLIKIADKEKNGE